MTREQLIAQAKAKYQREQLIAQAKAKYQAGGAQPLAQETIQEMPEWLSSVDRAVAKNLAQSPEKQAEYLKQKYPGAEVKLDEKGNVLLKQPSESTWRALDPDTGILSKDTLNDITDAGFDIISGAGQGIATAGGAIAGAFVGGGGAIPGAMIGSGLSSAGSEYLRQRLGKTLGIPQEVDGTDVVVAGGAGLISPLIFGAGKATTGVAANLAKKAGVSTARLEAAEQAGRGVLERGWDSAKQGLLPWLGEKVSGKSKEGIKAYANNMDTVDQLEKQGVDDYVGALKEKVQKALSAAKDRAGKAVQSAIDGAGKKVDITKAKAAFKDRINFLESRSELTNAELAEINSLKASYIKYFGLGKAVGPSEAELMSDPALVRLYDQLDNRLAQSVHAAPAKVGEVVEGSVLNQTPKTLPPPTSNWGRKEIMESPLDRNAAPVQGVVDDFFKGTNNEILGHAGLLKEEQEALAKAFASKNQSEIQAVIKQIEARKNEFVKDNTRDEVLNQIDASRAFDLQKKLKQAAAFETNMTPETLSAKGSARTAYGAINEGMDEATDGLSSKAKADYARWKGIEGELENSFADDQKTLNTVMGLNSRGKQIMKERLGKLADTGELDITPEIDVLQAYKEFADPSLMPVGFKGSTSTSRSVPLGVAAASLGYYAGAQSDLGQGGAGLGAGAGAAVGGLLGSPAMMKRLIRSNRSITDAARRAFSPVGGAAQIINPLATDGMEELAGPWFQLPTDTQY